MEYSPKVRAFLNMPKVKVFYWLSVGVSVMLGLSIGFIIWSAQSPISKITNRVVTDSNLSSPSPSPITWQNYENANEGYKLEVPSLFKHISSPDSDPEKLIATDYWYLGELSQPGGQCQTTGEAVAISAIAEKNYKNALSPKKPDNTVPVAGLKADEYVFPNWITIEPILHNQRAYKISYLPPCNKPDHYSFPQHLDEFNRMVQSLTFTQ